MPGLVPGLVRVLDAGQQACGGGGPSGPSLLSGGSKAAAELRKPEPIRSGSHSTAVSAPTCLHHWDTPQTLPSPTAGPTPPAGGRRPPNQPRRPHHLPRAWSAGLLPSPELGQLQEGLSLSVLNLIWFNVTGHVLNLYSVLSEHSVVRV